VSSGLRVVVRRLGTGDENAAVALVRSFAGKDITPSHAGRFLANPANYLIVAEADGSVIGFALAHALERLKEDSHKLFIYELEVAAEFRRRGVGRALIAHLRQVVERDRMLNAFVLTNHSNSAAVALYRRTGAREPNGNDLLFVYDGAPAGEPSGA
jgi:aminoglycoside 3-N-acetyltransferase I